MKTETTEIRDGMDVICSCGTRLGKVDHVDGDMIKLAKNDPDSGGVHHWVPLDWVDHVDRQVHITKNSVEARDEWEEDVD